MLNYNIKTVFIRKTWSTFGWGKTQLTNASSKQILRKKYRVQVLFAHFAIPCGYIVEPLGTNKATEVPVPIQTSYTVHQCTC